jgi:hypothetical protein
MKYKLYCSRIAAMGNCAPRIAGDVEGAIANRGWNQWVQRRSNFM